MYTNKYMAEHSMSGANSPKPAIPKEDRSDIVGKLYAM
jgi:hypothetical protein